VGKIRHKTQAAFTLVELMVSLALFSILIVLAITNTSFMQQSLVHSEIDKLYTIAHYLQRRAQLTHKDQVLQFDRYGRSYSFNGRKELLAKGIEFGTLATIKGPPSTPTHEITNPITFNGERITFKPQGIMQPGTVYFVHKELNCAYALSCAVAQVSFLRKYRYDKRWLLME